MPGLMQRALSAVLVGGFFATSAMAQSAARDGLALFGQLGCAGCHGDAGSGSALAPSIAGARISEAEFLAAVRNARGAMPSYSADVLTDADLAALRAALAAQPAQAIPSGRPEAGAVRFEQVGCYSCHSNQGQGGTQGPRIGPRPIRWERFTWYVRHPTGQMPPYSVAVVTDQDLADIHAFLASRPEPRPLSDLPLLAP